MVGFIGETVAEPHPVHKGITVRRSPLALMPDAFSWTELDTSSLTIGIEDKEEKDHGA